MHAGRRYRLIEFIVWTRKDIYGLLLISILPVFLYEIAGLKWLAVPWVPIALVGTAAAFIIGFKNTQTYNRLWEARQIYGAIVNSSRSWGIAVKDFISNQYAAEPVSPEELKKIHRQLIYRHLAWLTALRYQLREPRTWENMSLSYNAEYQNHYYKVPERETKLEDELHKYLSEEEITYVLGKKNRATQIIGLQSAQLRQLAEKGLLENMRYTAMEKMLTDFYDEQGRCERIKNFPYPRQFATLNMMFVRLFVIMVPLGMLLEFKKVGDNCVWLSIPFSLIVSWVFNTMEKIGQATENPFEGNANDVPITALSRTIEIDLRDMLDEKDLPPALQPVNNILM